MLILDWSIKWLKSVIDPDPESKISAAVVQACPKAAVNFFGAKYELNIFWSHLLTESSSFLNRAIQIEINFD